MALLKGVTMANFFLDLFWPGFGRRVFRHVFPCWVQLCPSGFSFLSNSLGFGGKFLLETFFEKIISRILRFGLVSGRGGLDPGRGFLG